MDTPVCFARFRTSETCLVSVHENLPDCFSKLFTYALFGGGLNYFKHFHDQICRFKPVFFSPEGSQPSRNSCSYRRDPKGEPLPKMVGNLCRTPSRGGGNPLRNFFPWGREPLEEPLPEGERLSCLTQPNNSCKRH